MHVSTPRIIFRRWWQTAGLADPVASEGFSRPIGGSAGVEVPTFPSPVGLGIGDGRQKSLKSPPPLPISVCIIAGNDVHRIGRTLESVKGWTSEIIVVVDDQVRDGTDLVAVEHGAKVFSHPWQGHAVHRNFATAQATQQWILAIDTDEVVSDDLRAEIIAAFQGGSRPPVCAAFSFPRLSYFCGRWIRHGDWYPDRKVRLWQKGVGDWQGSPHEKLVVRGTVKRLRGDLLHYSNESIEQFLGKMTRITDMFVQQHEARNRRAGWADLLIRPAWKFFRGYVIRGGFLDGWPGYVIASANAFSTLVRYSKVKEAKVGEGCGDNPKKSK
jgi:glycosyltransferase involved in cell wall biosynthesis